MVIGKDKKRREKNKEPLKRKNFNKNHDLIFAHIFLQLSLRALNSVSLLSRRNQKLHSFLSMLLI